MNVLVIGAGIVGAAIADALAVRGAEVTVLDMRAPGRGASQASAGLLTPYIEGRGDTPLLDLCARSLELYDGFFASVRDRSGVPVPYARSGTLEVALNDEEAARLRDMQSWLGERRVGCEWVTAADLGRLEPAVTSNAVGGLLIPSQGFVAVGAMVHALVQAARLSGAVFETPVEAARVESFADHVEVRAGDARYEADAVVVAAGTWSGRVKIAGAPSLPVRPVRGQLLQLAWTGPTLPRRPVWGTRAYTVPWPPDALLVGATVEEVGFDERSTVAGVRDLLDGVAELLPGAWDASLSDVRIGLRPGTPDNLPLIGPPPGLPRVCVATGHYRNGVLLAPLTADLVARYLLEGEHDPALAITAPARFAGSTP